MSAFLIERRNGVAIVTDPATLVMVVPGITPALTITWKRNDAERPALTMPPFDRPVPPSKAASLEPIRKDTLPPENSAASLSLASVIAPVAPPLVVPPLFVSLVRTNRLPGT